MKRISLNGKNKLHEAALRLRLRANSCNHNMKLFLFIYLQSEFYTLLGIVSNFRPTKVFSPKWGMYFLR